MRILEYEDLGLFVKHSNSGFSLTEYKDEACDFGNPINDPDLKSARDRVDAAISEKDPVYEKGRLRVREIEED